MCLEAKKKNCHFTHFLKYSLHTHATCTVGLLEIFNCVANIFCVFAYCFLQI